LLDGLAAHTGYEISILAGRVKKSEEKLDIECVRQVMRSSVKLRRVRLMVIAACTRGSRIPHHRGWTSREPIAPYTQT
jgi:hypothetical protein